MGCTLNCNTGICKILQGQGPKCICPPAFTGSRCEQYRCSQYCKNHGMCYIDIHAIKSPDVQPPLRCNCPPQWTGERCETPLNMCENRCYNEGICTVLENGMPQCNCPPGYTGVRCQNCDNLSCENGGVCSKDDNKEVCSCSPGYKGSSCELSACGKFGKPIYAGSSFRCACLPGYSGEKCDRDMCWQHCQNGGTCIIGTKQPECICPKNYSGRRCENDHTKTKCSCQNGGECVAVNEKIVCKCPDQWGGYTCEVS